MHNVNFAHSIICVLQIIMDFGDNTNAGQIGKLIMNLFLSRFNTSMKCWGWIFFGVCVFSSLQYKLHWVGDYNGVLFSCLSLILDTNFVLLSVLADFLP